MALKLVSFEDYSAIANLMGTYQHLVDDGDEDGYADLFTEDGALTGLPVEAGSFQGREGLKQIPRITLAVHGGKYRHHMGSFSAQYGDSKDEAFARYYILGTTWQPEGAQLTQFAIVRTHLVRTSEGWRIKTNNVSLL